MLTSDLLRARRRGDQVHPAFVGHRNPGHLALAEKLVAAFSAHVGKRRSELDDALAEIAGLAPDALLHRGLAKLLFDRSELEVEAPISPAELRRKLFERAAAHFPVAQRDGDPMHPVTRDAVLAEVAGELGLAPERVERALYADLEREHVLRHFDPLSPEELLQRYDVALAQAVLFRATSLTLRIAAGSPKRYRQLFRFIKFYRLMHTVRGDRAMGYEVTLDGPASVLHLSTRYGLQLAELLPALLLCEGWSMKAELLWARERRPALFQLDSRCGLVSHYPDRGVYVTEEERTLVERFEALGTRWKVEVAAELIDLGGVGVLVPDLVFTHRDDGRTAFLEIVGFWRRGYLDKRVELLRAHAPGNLVLAVSRRLAAAREAVEELPSGVYVFSEVIRAKEILARIERVATR